MRQDTVWWLARMWNYWNSVCDGRRDPTAAYPHPNIRISVSETFVFYYYTEESIQLFGSRLISLSRQYANMKNKLRYNHHCCCRFSIWNCQSGVENNKIFCLIVCRSLFPFTDDNNNCHLHMRIFFFIRLKVCFALCQAQAKKNNVRY